VEQEVLELISGYTGVAVQDIHPTQRLQEDLGLDSIDALEILTSVEAMTGQRFETEELNGMVYVSDVLERLRAGTG
jgi:acyl carrier protein